MDKETSQNTNSDIKCPICFDNLDGDIVTLNCGHKFHYDCIFNSYLSKFKSNKYNIRTCPYCREYGGYLDIKKGVWPEKYIHKEFNEIMDCLILNDYVKLSKITEK